MAEWQRAAKARRDFADMIESLTPEQLEADTLCGEWTPKGVLAHLTTFAEISLPALFGNLIRNGFNFDKAAVKMAAKREVRGVDALLESLRKNATKSAPLPNFPEELTLSDVAIHTQDVRRPLGLSGSLDEDVVRSALEFLTEHKQATTLVHRPPIEGVSLKATDLDWSFGDGPEISGTGEAIMMGLAQRTVLDDLSGEGLAAWK